MTASPTPRQAATRLSTPTPPTARTAAVPTDVLADRSRLDTPSHHVGEDSYPANSFGGQGRSDTHPRAAAGAPNHRKARS